MPFTPVHMGPGIRIKSVLGGSFSLMIFGWTQIIVDLQPLYVLIRGEGHLHGFSHTYLGSSLLAIVAALTGKWLSEFGLWLLGLDPSRTVKIPWVVVFVSAFIGSSSHVLLDSIMHSDVRPFFPISDANIFLRLVSTGMLHILCLVAGVIGALIYFLLMWRSKET